MQKLENLLTAHRLSHLAPVLQAAAIDLDIAADLTEADLQSLGISLGDCKRLRRALAAPGNAAVSPEGERRVLTAAFIDLAGFTELSTALDPEVLHGAVSEYQQLATSVLTQWGGAVAQYLGDGVLAYFGYPRAHEDDAERAVRASLAIVEGTAALSAAGTALRARAGIATGLVVVGSVVTGELVAGSVAIGEAPNRAARLQGYGGPGEVIIDAATQRLLGNGVHLQPLAPALFKGFSQPVNCWRVTGSAATPSRFQDAEITGELLGRDNELASLRSAWKSACDGRGGTLLMRGEAGMGKSRLVAELVNSASDAGAAVLLLQCSAHHTATDYYALRQAFERAVPHSADEPVHERLARWIADFAQDAMREACSRAQRLVPLLVTEDTGELVSQHELRLRLVDLVYAAASKRAVLVVLEDLHWADPSTVEWFRAAAAKLRDHRLMLIATSRSEGEAIRLKADVQLDLLHLPSDSAEALVHRAADGRRLPRAVLAAILERAGGVPLYVEEITRAVVESGSLDLSTVEVPATLQASLLARFDRLGSAREIVQVASVIGRTFDLDLVTAVAGLSTERVLAALWRVAEAGLMIAPSQPSPTSEWTFKHALIQESAYSTLLHSVRRQLHSRVADLLVEHNSRGQGLPEAVAWHLTAAGRNSEAVEAWNAAAESAASRGAAGTQHHYEQALALIRQQPVGRARDEQELAQLLKLGPVLMMTKGVGAQGGVEIYERARELSREVGTTSQRFLVAFGLWYSYEHQGRTEQQAAMLRSMRDMALASGDARELLQVHHAEWETCLNRVQLQDTIRAANAGLAIYDARDRPLYLRHFGGHDPATCALTYRATAEWTLGHAAQAFRTFDEAFARAAESGDMGTRVIATITFGGVCFMGREPKRILDVYPPVFDACRRAGFATGILMLGMGWAQVMLGQPYDISMMRRMVEGLRRSGVRIRLAYYEVLLADALRVHGDLNGAKEHLIAARACSESANDDTVIAKINTLDGDLHLLEGDQDGALRCWQEALRVAGQQHAVFFQIDAALRIARLQQASIEGSKAATLLAELVTRVGAEERGAIIDEARSWMHEPG